MSVNKIAAKVAAKSLKKSVTVKVNAIIAMLTVMLSAAEMQLHVLKDALGEKWWGIAFFALAMTNVVLRFRTEFKHVKPQIEGE